jgi:hypothetical protein
MLTWVLIQKEVFSRNLLRQKKNQAFYFQILDLLARQMAFASIRLGHKQIIVLRFEVLKAVKMSVGLLGCNAVWPCR